MTTETRQLAILTDRASETAFFNLLARNCEVTVKELSQKIPRKMLYKYLSNLNNIQAHSGMTIFKKTAIINRITGQPNIAISTLCRIELKTISKQSALVLIHNN
ncbi:hypothetical protein ACFL3V_05095 [Nanoarchaeota archaeon]